MAVDLSGLSPRSAERIMRALGKLATRDPAAHTVADVARSLFDPPIPGAAPEWYTPSIEDLAAMQPRPPGVGEHDTLQIKTFDFEADRIDSLLESQGLPVRRRQSPRCRLFTIDQLPALASYPGYVALSRGDGTFLVKMHLRKLGGFWQPQFETEPFVKGAWLVPAGRAEEAFALVQEAERTQTVPDVGAITEPKVRCFECGASYTVTEFLKRPGYVAHDWYCGCLEGRGRRQSKS